MREKAHRKTHSVKNHFIYFKPEILLRQLPAPLQKGRIRKKVEKNFQDVKKTEILTLCAFFVK